MLALHPSSLQVASPDTTITLTRADVSLCPDTNITLTRADVSRQHHHFVASRCVHFVVSWCPDKCLVQTPSSLCSEQMCPLCSELTNVKSRHHNHFVVSRCPDKMLSQDTIITLPRADVLHHFSVEQMSIFVQTPVYCSITLPRTNKNNTLYLRHMSTFIHLCAPLSNVCSQHHKS